jgi:hypothetical protein
MEANTAHKRIQITIETERVLMIRRRASIRLWCQECGFEVDVVDLIQAQFLSGLDRPTLHQPALHAGVQAIQWHSLAGPDGAPLVCLESVLKSM